MLYSQFKAYQLSEAVWIKLFSTHHIMIHHGYRELGTLSSHCGKLTLHQRHQTEELKALASTICAILVVTCNIQHMQGKTKLHITLSKLSKITGSYFIYVAEFSYLLEGVCSLVCSLNIANKGNPMISVLFILCCNAA